MVLDLFRLFASWTFLNMSKMQKNFFKKIQTHIFYHLIYIGEQCVSQPSRLQKKTCAPISHTHTPTRTSTFTPIHTPTFTPTHTPTHPHTPHTPTHTNRYLLSKPLFFQMSFFIHWNLLRRYCYLQLLLETYVDWNFRVQLVVQELKT